MDIWMESRFVSATSWHPDLFGALHLVDLQGSSPSSMLGATASLIRLKRNGVSGRGHLMPPCSFLRLGAVAGVPPAALQGGSLSRHLALAAILSLLLALVACSGSPTGRTPIPALNTSQISATQQAQVSEIKTRYAPTSERVTPPPPTIPPTPVLTDPGPTPRLLPTIEPPPPLPAFPPPPACCVSDLRTIQACGTNPRSANARNESCPAGLPGPDIISTHGGNGLRFVESGFDRTPGEDRQYKSVYSQETAGCVDWQVDLPGVEPAGTADIEAVSELLGPNDEVLEHLAMEFELNPGTAHSWISLGHGWGEPGNRATGE